MSEQSGKSIHELFADRDLITAAINRGVREALLKHARDGQTVATWRDGKVVWVPAEELLAQFPDAGPPNGLPPNDQPGTPAGLPGDPPPAPRAGHDGG
jgi:hypothetical protein